MSERAVKSIEKKLENLGDDFCYPTRRIAQRTAVRLVNHLADLEHRYWIAHEFSALLAILLRVKTRAAYRAAMRELTMFFKTTFSCTPALYQKRIIRMYRKFESDKPFLFTHLRYPELRIPYTTNLQEGYHSHWESRLSSIRGFESEETAKNYLNALVLKRRFSILTSCRKRFRHLNGKSPLEHSGGLTVALKDWMPWSIRLNKKRAT